MGSIEGYYSPFKSVVFVFGCALEVFCYKNKLVFFMIEISQVFLVVSKRRKTRNYILLAAHDVPFSILRLPNVPVKGFVNCLILSHRFYRSQQLKACKGRQASVMKLALW